MRSSTPPLDEALSPEHFAVRHLAAHGFEATTATELADAMGMSRSTFFRRFGSKEGVIFADHDRALSRLEHLLADTALPPSTVVARSTLEVMRVLVSDPGTARLRWELLRQNPSLRERELVITHRYERVFADFLARTAVPGTPRWVPVALAAGLVSVHNAALRRWLRGSDPLALDSLERELHELVASFGTWFGDADAPGDASAGHFSRIVVAAFDASASPEEVLRALAERLGEATE